MSALGLGPFNIARIVSSGASAHCRLRVYEFGSRGCLLWQCESVVDVNDHLVTG